MALNVDYVKGETVVIITGASRGIGKFLLQRLSAEMEVIGFYNCTKPDEPGKRYFKVDISKEDEVIKFIASQKDLLKKIVLLNCAGTNYNSIAHKSDTASWINVINVNLIGTFLVIKSLLPLMRDQEYGRIVNFSSVVAQKGIPGTSAYAASKAALWGLTRAISVENAKKGITINSLNLGYCDIGMIQEVPVKFQDNIKETIPMGRFGSPENILIAVKYLIESDYITGTSIDINGGLC